MKIKEFGKKIEKIGDKITKEVGKRLLSEKRIKSKRILEPSRARLKLDKFTPAPYVSRYFSDEMKEEKRSMFFEWYSIWDLRREERMDKKGQAALGIGVLLLTFVGVIVGVLLFQVVAYYFFFFRDRQ